MSDQQATLGRVGASINHITRTFFIVFLVLKLTGLIAWSWWWVFSPLWIPLFIVLIIVFLAALIRDR